MKHLILDKTCVVATDDGRLEISKTCAHDRMGKHHKFEEQTYPVILDRVEAHRLAAFIRREISPASI